MAHYKRRKCRYNGKARANSTTFYRKRNGLKPIVVPSWRDAPRWNTPEYDEYHRWRDSMRRIWWPAEFSMMSGNPRAWDILFHTRPRRAKEKAMTRKVLIGAVDAENITWPLSKRPRVYYW